MTEKKEMFFYVKGTWVSESNALISIYDYGLQYGDGILEGLRIYDGSIFKLDEHLDRLERSMRAIKIVPLLEKKDFKEICLEFVKRNKVENGHMKIIVTRGQGYRMALPETEPCVYVFGRLLKAYFDKGSGLRLKTSSVRRNSPESLDPRIKSTNYLNSILSRLEVFAFGADDALQLDMQGNIAEASAANVFVIKDGTLKTPRKCNILEGITRQTVIELAKKGGYIVSEEDLTLYDIYTADEAFLCGSAVEIAPIVEVDGRKLDELGKITKKIQKMFHDLTRNKN